MWKISPLCQGFSFSQVVDLFELAMAEIGDRLHNLIILGINRTIRWVSSHTYRNIEFGFLRDYRWKGHLILCLRLFLEKMVGELRFAFSESEKFQPF